MSRKIAALLALLASALMPAAASAQSWAAPSLTPPNGNVSVPLNISSTAQSKSGGLLLNTGGATNGLIVQYGNVGIGNTSPRALLDLAKQNNVGQVLLIGETATNNRVGFGLDSSTASMRIFTVNNSSQFISFGGVSNTDGATYTEYSRIGVGGGNSYFNTGGGSVGIGTAAPGYKLEVSGSVGASSFFYTSDRSLKKNIAPLE
ncbi:MAG TPA: hypothetical protein VFT82_02255, partial [Candidatus Paceibacterota bacterium]|nr:hypothetical protein [Candidatus Paceibacterota bacterium]